MEDLLRRDGANNGDVVLRIDSENNDQNEKNKSRGTSGSANGDGEMKAGGGIWRGSSYDFLNNPDKAAMYNQRNLLRASEEQARSFVFRNGSNPTSQLIGDFVERERMSGHKYLDMDFDIGENENENDDDVIQKPEGLISSVPETERVSIQLQSETSSPKKGVLRYSPVPSPLVSGTSTVPSYPPPSPTSSTIARSLSPSPKVQFESWGIPAASSRVQIGSPIYEGGPRYSHKEDEPVPKMITGNGKGNGNSNIENPVGSERKKSGGEVVRCSSRASSNINLLRTKTRSRLIDPPPPAHYGSKTGGREAALEAGSGIRRRSSQLRSGQLKSGMTGKSSGLLKKLNEQEDDDPFQDCDLPDELRHAKWDFLCLFQWFICFVIVGSFICSIAIDCFRRKTVWGLHLWKWCLLVLFLFCGRLVSGWVIRILVFCVERNFLLRKRVLYFVYGLRKAVQNCLWLGLVLLAWHLLFDKEVERETNSKALRHVNKMLVCLVVGSCIWLLKTLMMKVMASSFHVNTYFDRIQESLFNQYVLETLSGPPLIEIEWHSKEEERLMNEVVQLKEAGANISIDLKSGFLHKAGAMTTRSGMIGISGRSMGVKSDKNNSSSKQRGKGITIDHLHKLNQKNISAWNMKRLMNIVRRGVLSTLDVPFQSAATEDESVKQIRSEWEAKASAKDLFENVAQPPAKHISIEDLMRFLREEEALKAMTLFEGAQDTNQVNKAALKQWVVHVFRERRALALTLNDTKTAVNKLHQMLNVVVALIITLIWLLILGIATRQILVLISSQMLLVVFVFGNTCKTLFESIVFLFAMHPFDVGDRCSVEGIQMVVEEMNILTTVFLRYDNEKIWYPNTILATKPISNFNRSPDMGDAVDFNIHIATPKEKVDIMKERITRYIDNKAEHWYPNPMVVVTDIDDMNKMKMAVWLQHKMNHQDMGEKWLRRSQLIEEMIGIFRDLDINYRLLPRDVNLRTMPTPPLTSTRFPSTWVT